MVEDVMSHWVQNVKDKDQAEAKSTNNDVKVVRREHKPLLKSQGALILELAEKLFPATLKLFHNERDENGMLFQPARIRGIALNVAQYMVKHQEEDQESVH